MLREGVQGVDLLDRTPLGQEPRLRRKALDSASDLLELAGELRLLSRLLAAPPDARLLAGARCIMPGKGRPASLVAIRVAFTRLLGAPGPEAVASNQFCYTDTPRLDPAADSMNCGLSFPMGESRGFQGGESCSESRCWYLSAGFSPPDPAPAMADHVSSHLAFISHLYLYEARSLAAGELEEARELRRLRVEFFNRFTGRWLEAFARKLVANGASTFYRRVGRRILAWNERQRAVQEPDAGRNAAAEHARACLPS
jgi:hypothetical protein